MRNKTIIVIVFTIVFVLLITSISWAFYTWNELNKTKKAQTKTEKELLKTEREARSLNSDLSETEQELKSVQNKISEIKKKQSEASKNEKVKGSTQECDTDTSWPITQTGET